MKNSLSASAKDGRLFIILAKMNDPEPRLTLGRTGLDAPQVLARDLKGIGPGAVAVADASTFAFPITNLSGVPAGDYFVQALFDSNADLRLRDAPGNLYSKPNKIHFDPAQGGDWKLELTEQVPADQLPEDRRFNPLALNPYVLYKALPQVKRYTQAELIRAMDLLFQCNLRLVSTSLDESLVLQQTLVQIVEARA